MRNGRRVHAGTDRSRDLLIRESNGVVLVLHHQSPELNAPGQMRFGASPMPGLVLGRVDKDSPTLAVVVWGSP